MVLSLPAEWTNDYIKSAIHWGIIKPVTADEWSSITVEDMISYTDPNQEKLPL
jgi:hypothetical protein